MQSTSQYGYQPHQRKSEGDVKHSVVFKLNPMARAFYPGQQWIDAKCFEIGSEIQKIQHSPQQAKQSAREKKDTVKNLHTSMDSIVQDSVDRTEQVGAEITEDEVKLLGKRKQINEPQKDLKRLKLGSSEKLYISLQVVDWDEGVMNMRMKQSSRIRDLLKIYSRKTGLSSSSLRLIVDGQRVGSGSLGAVGLKNGHTVSVVRQQLGGGPEDQTPPKEVENTSSRAKRTRTANLPMVLKINETYEVHMAWKFSDSKVGLYSASPKSASIKVPWGSLKDVKLEERKNAKGEKGLYFTFGNEKNEYKSFQVNEMSVVIWKTNDYTLEVQRLKSSKKEDLLAMYWKLMLKSEGFRDYVPESYSTDGRRFNGKGIQECDLVKLGGSLQDLASFIAKAKSSAEIVGSLTDVPSKLSGTPKAVSEEWKTLEGTKSSKSNSVKQIKDSMLKDERGPEKQIWKGWAGRSDIPLDKLSRSEKVFSKFSAEKVKGVKESIKNSFEPSLVRFVVCCKDPTSFDKNHPEDSEYEVLQGRHLLEALVELEQEGELKKLKTLNQGKVTCFILRSQSDDLKNYVNIRSNEIEAEWAKKTNIDELLLVHSGLRDVLGDDESVTAVLRYADFLGFSIDDKAALKKLLKWRSNDLNILVNVLGKYQSYQTLDSKTNLKRIESKLKAGDSLPVAKTLFRKLSKVSPEYFVSNYNEILEKKISLGQMINQYAQIEKRNTVRGIIVKLAGYSKEFLENNEDKFSDNVLDSFVGAQVGNKINNTGQDLVKYCKSVLEKTDSLPSVDYKVISTIAEVSDEDLDEVDTLVFYVEDRMEDLCPLLEKIRNEKHNTSFLLIFKNRNLAESVFVEMTHGENQELLKPQKIYFDNTEPDINGNVSENIRHAIFSGHVYRPPLMELNLSPDSNVQKVVQKISPASPKIFCVSESSLNLLRLEGKFGNITYLAPEKSLQALQDERNGTAPHQIPQNDSSPADDAANRVEDEVCSDDDGVLDVIECKSIETPTQEYSSDMFSQFPSSSKLAQTSPFKYVSIKDPMTSPVKYC